MYNNIIDFENLEIVDSNMTLMQLLTCLSSLSALYGLIALSIEVEVQFAKRIETFTSFPDQCAEIFLDAKKLTPWSQVIYGFNPSGGSVSVRICTNETLDSVDKQITAQSRLTGKELLGCDPSDPTDYQDLIANCVPEDTSKSCEDILSTSPAPDGFLWSYAVTKLSTMAGRCAVRLRDISNAGKDEASDMSDFAPCSLQNVFMFKSVLTHLQVISAFGLAGRVFAELFSIVNCRAKSALFGWHYLFVKSGNDSPSPSLQIECVVLVSKDLIGGVIAGAVAFAPCSPSANGRMFTVLLISVIDVCFTVGKLCFGSTSNSSFNDIKIFIEE